MTDDTTGPVLTLLPSPLLGPAVWAPVAGLLAQHGRAVTVAAPPSPRRTPDDVLDAFRTALPARRDAVVVAHSNAGAYVPALTAHDNVVGALFVDAILPPPGGQVRLSPSAALDGLRTMADEAGLLPAWSSWWDDVDVAALFPDPVTRSRVEAEQQRLPIDYFASSLPVARGWDAVAAAYLAFGDTYRAERRDAEGRGWPTRTLSGGHLHMLVDPAAVTAAVIELCDHIEG